MEQINCKRKCNLNFSFQGEKVQIALLRFLSFSAGLFDTSSGAQESAFRRAVTAVNDDRSILTKSLVVAEVGRYKNYILKMMMNQLIKD